MKEEYYNYIRENSVEGSGTAHSYVRALDMLGPILKERTTEFAQYSDIWSIQSPKTISLLYEFVKIEQRKKASGIFGGHKPSSYWKGGYYSAALGSYREFLVIDPHEKRLWKILNQPKATPAKIAEEMSKVKIDSAKELVLDRGLDFRTKEGKDVLKQTKARVNQDFFRKMILAEYRCECCVTGLNIPEVLRASHIVSWAEDKKNRMNPANGLCLSATYDAAFDRHLISFDENYRLILSPTLKEYYTNKAFNEQFLKLKGQKIQMPGRFRPDKGLLETHRGKLVD